MIITCPHCQTKYQVTYEAIGSVGRKVQCAHCQQAWQQRPLDTPEVATPAQKQAFDSIEEDALDEAMQSEAQEAAAEQAGRMLDLDAPGDDKTVDPALARSRQKAFKRRQTAIAAELPLARMRRSLRFVGLTLLAGSLATAYFGRVMVVERFPDMAGVYAAVGLGVNVVGLDFSNVSSQRTLRDGKEVLVVSAQIVGLQPDPVPVPAVVVTLIDPEGLGVYEWSITPSVRDLMVGERATFDTQLTLPPGEAARVRLSFDGGQSMPVTAADARPPAEAPAASADQSQAPAASGPATLLAPTHTSPEQH